MHAPLSLTPIGIVHTPFRERVEAPRQTYVARDVPGTIELDPGRGFEDALSDLEGWDYLWVIFLFHLNEGWRPKVLPPRSGGKKRGLFATRSPYRPNPIGLSVVRLDSIVGLTLHIRGVDMLDGSPVLDIKPYVPVADAIPDARTGWLVPDPEPGFSVVWGPMAAESLAWLAERGVNLREPIHAALSLGPQPHAYRRIKPEGDTSVLAIKEWRARFRAVGRVVTVLAITSGYREKQLASGRAPTLHQDYVAWLSEGSSVSARSALLK